MHAAIRFPLLASGLAVFLFLFLPHTSFAATVTVTMNDNSFGPKNVTIYSGDTVTWVNGSTMGHTTTADNGTFDSGTIASGQSYGAIFNAAGTYAYHCKFHGGPGGTGMAGTITVVEQGTVTNTSSYNNPNANYYSNINANASTNSSSANLQAQAQALVNQIAALKQKLGYGGTPGAANTTAGGVSTYSAACPLIGRNLSYGASGDDVSRLQQFLAQDKTVYPDGTVSGYYGNLTQTAVQRWQAKYNIVSSGSPSSTGYGVVGPRTAAAIAIICAGGSLNGVPGPTQPPPAPVLGGFISVTPITGAAPLVVNVTATLNTGNSCLGGLYTLDFGDGNVPLQIPVPAGNCGQLNQTHPHTYQYGGSYVITLSAGSHQTSATVTLTGPVAPPPRKITTGIPLESFQVNPSSGVTPLTVTFSGVVNSNDAGFCQGGCASAIDFGDGTSGTVDLPAAEGGWLNYSVTHTYTTVGGFKATLYQGGAGASQPIVGSATIVASAGTPSFGATPVSGYPPLAVGFSATGLSSAGLYGIDYADATPIARFTGSGNWAAGDPKSAWLHTYSTSGTYTAQLLSYPPAGNGCQGNCATTPTVIGTTGITVESLSGNAAFSAYPTSGQPPVDVSFTMNVSQTTGIYKLDFGDGSAPRTFGCQAGASCPTHWQTNHTYAQTGTFVAKLTSPSGAGVGAVTISVSGGSTNTNSNSNSNSNSYSYSPPSLLPGSNLFTYSLQFDLPSLCTGYDISWGDSSSNATQSDGGSSCSGGSVTRTVAHSYTSDGDYTIALRRGPSLSTVNDVAVNVTHY